MDTFTGRFVHFNRVVNPVNALYLDQTLVEFSHRVSELRQRSKTLTNIEQKEMDHKSLILSSSVNPDTLEVIPWHMRTTTFVPMGMPIMAGMLMTAPTLPNIIFW